MFWKNFSSVSWRIFIDIVHTKKYLKLMRKKFDNVLFSMKYCTKENEIHEISVFKQWEILLFFLRGKSIRDNVYFFSPRQHSVFFNSSLAFLSVFHSQLLFFRWNIWGTIQIFNYLKKVFYDGPANTQSEV